MGKVIDAHVHLSERKDDLLIDFAKKGGMRYTLDELLMLMKKHGIGQGLLLSPPLRDGRPSPNEDTLLLCERSQGILQPVITVEPTRAKVDAAVRLAKKHRGSVKALKVRLGYAEAPAISPVFDPAYDYADAEGLPVLFHTGDTATEDGDLMSSHPLSLDRLANRREGLKIVLCHFGNPWFDDVAELIYKHPNVYADISGLTTGGGAYAGKFLQWLSRRISEAIYFSGGAEKIIFGTDYPVTKPSDALALVKALDVTEADRERILWRNAERVFGL